MGETIREEERESGTGRPGALGLTQSLWVVSQLRGLFHLIDGSSLPVLSCYFLFFEIRI